MKRPVFAWRVPMAAACSIAVALLCSSNIAAAAGGSFPELIQFGNAQPEGVAVDKKGNVFVSVDVPIAENLMSAQVWKFTPRGEMSVLADLGSPGKACGLAVDATGDVYLAQYLVPARGVYRIRPDGSYVRLPGTEQIIGADALAFDQRGTLYITEIFSAGDAPGNPFSGPGRIWRVTKKGGVAELWLEHELLTGLAPTVFPFWVGANGIAFFKGDLYVANTDRALILKIPVLPDGSPGEPVIWRQLEETEGGVLEMKMFPLMIDGIAMDVHGNVYAAVPSRSAVVRFNASDLRQDTIAIFPDAAVDAPLSLAFGTGKGEQKNLFITNSGLSASFPPLAGYSWPGAGILKVDAGMPGLPLP